MSTEAETQPGIRPEPEAEIQPEAETPTIPQPEVLVRPEDLQAEFGIKKDAYYEDIKFLKGLGFAIPTRKDADKKTLLEPESAALIRALRQHVVAMGQREGFQSGALAESSRLVPQQESGATLAPSGTTPTVPTELQGGADSLIEQAQQLAAQRMMTTNLVVAELAEQMTYEDLPPDLQSQVSQVQAATHPKPDPAAIAAQLLQQHRTVRGGTPPAG